MFEARSVKDVMLPLDAYATISADATISAALVALSKAQMGLTYDRHHHRAILVLDAEGEVIGKLTHWSILRALEPRLLGEGDLYALARSGVGPELIREISERAVLPEDLSLLCQVAARTTVRQAMVPARETIGEEAPLTCAIRMFVLGHWQSLLVTRGGRVVGILRLADVFEEVADLIRAAAA